MANEYLQWSDEMLIEQGKKLKEAVEMAKKHHAKMSESTKLELLQKTNVFMYIQSGENALYLFREEYKKRLKNKPQ